MNARKISSVTCCQLCLLLPIKNKSYPDIKKLAGQDVRVLSECEQCVFIPKVKYIHLLSLSHAKDNRDQGLTISLQNRMNFIPYNYFPVSADDLRAEDTNIAI